MPRWLLGGICGVFTAGINLASLLRQELSSDLIVITITVRILIGLVIGSPLYYKLPRQWRWIRGAGISLVLSIPLALWIPNLWQSMLGMGIAYGAIIGYLVDRILPLSSDSGA